jgi:hypothetical protein
VTASDWTNGCARSLNMCFAPMFCSFPKEDAVFVQVSSLAGFLGFHRERTYFLQLFSSPVQVRAMVDIARLLVSWVGVRLGQFGNLAYCTGPT